jgi:hypothetical protein
MPRIIVEIEYDSPTDPMWLNPDNVAMALNSYCKNTRFRCAWAECGNPWQSAESVDTAQLKAEIRAISDIIEVSESGIVTVDFACLKQRLRELSAV